MPRLALYALAVCVLTVAAAVVSFVQGQWIGVVWVLMAGLSSTMAWFYFRRAKAERQRQQQTAGV
jgi:CHASE2 domain-containing sensor protein